jgi:hypothetical protein
MPFVLFECLLVEQNVLCVPCHTRPDTDTGQAAEGSVPAGWVAPSADDAELLKVLEAANAEILRVWMGGTHGNKQPTTRLAFSLLKGMQTLPIAVGAGPDDGRRAPTSHHRRKAARTHRPSRPV